MTGTPDPQTVQEIARDAIRRAMNSRPAEYIEAACIAHGGIGLVLSEFFDAYTKAVAAECDRLTAARGPAEQPQDEQDDIHSASAAANLRVWLDSRHGADTLGRDVRAVLDNREQWRNLALSRGREQDGDVRAVAPCCGGPTAGWIHAADCGNPAAGDAERQVLLPLLLRDDTMRTVAARLAANSEDADVAGWYTARAAARERFAALDARGADGSAS